MKDSNHFIVQLEDLLDKHDGMQVILEHNKITSEGAAEIMLQQLLKVIHNNAGEY